MKKKIIIGFVILIIIIISCILGIYKYLDYRDSNISLINENIVIEYGESYKPNINELIDLKRYNFVDESKVTIKNEISNEEGKDYPVVGSYNIYVSYKNKELVQKVEVKDSTGPEILINGTIELPYNTDLDNYDFSSYIEIKDLSETKGYNIDLSNVDREKAGEYIAEIETSDIYDNKSQKEFKIIIQNETEEIPSNEETSKTSNQLKVQNNKQNKNSNLATSTVVQQTENKKQTSETNIQSQSTKKVDLSKYSYYEQATDGSYKAFLVDRSEINKLRGLINNAINSFGYKNIRVVEDSSLPHNGTMYFTANRTNVENAVYDSDGFTIYYYAVKEYLISSNGTENYFQTRSYIKVK